MLKQMPSQQMQEFGFRYYYYQGTVPCQVDTLNNEN